MAQARERFQRDLDQSKADHQEHFKRMETKINEAASTHETQHQRSQRDLELRAQEVAAKNAALEEELCKGSKVKKKRKWQEPSSFLKQLKAPSMLMQTKRWSS